MKARGRAWLVALALLASLGSSRAASAGDLAVTHGVMSGDVTATSATVWARASEPAELSVAWGTDPTLAHARTTLGSAATDASDLTARARLDGLQPGTRYWYRASFSGGRSRARERSAESQVGTFATAPSPDESRPVSFVVGGDIGGQQLCRNADQGGYAIFSAMEALEPDFFVMNGDDVYVDGNCPANGPPGWRNIPGDFPNVADPSVDWTNAPLVRDIFLRHWRYNRGDPFMQRFLQLTPMYSQWDDHEVINDFGAQWTYWNSANIGRRGYPNLVDAGRDSFFLYSPIARDPVEPNRIYRSFRWGKDVELFLLDGRSYRDRNDLPDTPENHKSLLGPAQLAWLEEGLRRSTATWKIVSSDTPLSSPTGSVAFGRDSFANIGAEPTGFESELLRLLAALDRDNVRNIVFCATDVHFAQTISYHVDADGDGDFLDFHELISGPLNAIRLLPQPLDPAASPTSLYAEGNLFNFEYVRVQDEGGRPHLRADVHGADGAVRPGSQLDLAPAP